MLLNLSNLLSVYLNVPVFLEPTSSKQ